MEILQYAEIIWKRLWLILLGTFLSAVVAYIMSSQQPPIYRATSVLQISGNSNEIVSDYRAILAAENLIPTYAKQLVSRSVQREVMEALQLHEWTSEVSTNAIPDTQLLVLNVEDKDPDRAMKIANLMPVVFMRQDIEVQQKRLATVEETISQQLAATQADIDATHAAITALRETAAPNQAELDRLQNELYEYQAGHATFTHNYQEVRLAQIQIFDPLMISERAILPRTPVKPRIMTNTLLAGVTGAMLAVGVVFLIEYLDNTVKTSEDLQRTLGFSALGTIPEIQSDITGGGSLISISQPRMPIVEAYRILRTNLQLRTIDAPVNTILITSSIPGEGKSTTSANLGVVMAQADLSVIMADTDLRRPILHKLFQLPNDRGVTTALLDDESAIEDHLQGTSVKNLRVLTSGPLPPNPSELLGSKRMERLIHGLKEKADIIIFDSPPLLAIADATVLANGVDGVLAVASAGETRHKTIVKTVETLRANGANLLGVVLVRFRPGYMDDYYYDHYATEGEKGRQSFPQRLREALRWSNQ
jgi:non-specific protein-tyrosine kinase